jgi:hypothetical protein
MVQHLGIEALSYSGVCYWMRERDRCREQVEDAGRSTRSSDFVCHSKIQPAREEMPIVSVRQLAEIFHYSPSTVFYVLTFVLRLKFRYWKWIPTFYGRMEHWASAIVSIDPTKPMIVFGLRESQSEIRTDLGWKFRIVISRQQWQD